MAEFLRYSIKEPWSPLTEYVTVTAKGVPLDSPVLPFIGLDGRTIDITSGLAYPLKAERARRNPHVGLLFKERDPSRTPAVMLISALATVRDADLQANTDRFLPEEAAAIPWYMEGLSWETISQAVHYLVRIYVHCTPVRILWWPDGNTDESPVTWQAPAGQAVPPSDPAPAGKSLTSPWSPADWRARAEDVVKKVERPHLMVVDEEGFPLPFVTKGVSLTPDGFDIDLPAFRPWPLRGPASLSFQDYGNFVGTVSATEGGAHFVVERCVGDLPHGPAGGTNVFLLEGEPREVLMTRLHHELERRGQPMPVVHRY